MKREALLATARKHMWAAWQLSSEELASQAADTLIGLGMLVEEGGAQELDRLRVRLDEVHRIPQDTLTPAEVRLSQYGERTKSWSTATYDGGTERALHEIACALRDTLEEVRDQRNAARLKVLGLEAERHETNSALSEITVALRDKQDAPLTVFRAEHDSIVFGLYTTAEAAREHCEAHERHSWPTGTTLAFDWIEDEEDGVAELAVTAGQNEESTTGYVVIALEVASAYDPETDE
jgi:hypothetical protein